MSPSKTLLQPTTPAMITASSKNTSKLNPLFVNRFVSPDKRQEMKIAMI